jgi:hypothetical protein
MNPTSTHQQQQFLTILDRDTALARFRALLDLTALPAESDPARSVWRSGFGRGRGIRDQRPGV